MGWTGIYDVHRSDIHDEVENLFRYDKIAGTDRKLFDILLHSTYGNTHYLAVRDNTTDETHAYIILTHYDSKNRYFVYKDLCEEMGVEYRGAPLKILDLLSDTDNEIALKWRKNVRDWNTRQSWLRKHLVEGAVIELAYPVRYAGSNDSSTFTLSKHGVRRGFSFAIPSGGHGRSYRGWKNDVVSVNGVQAPVVAGY